METLMSNLKTHNLIDDAGNIILTVNEDGQYQAVDQVTFQGFFGTTDYSYTQLKAADQGKGYSQFFDEWHLLGII